MIKINLNPYKKEKKEKIASQIKIPFKFENVSSVVYVAPALILIAGAILYTFNTSNEVNKLKKEKEQLVSEINKYKKIRKKIKTLRKVYSELESISKEVDLKKAVYTYLSKERPNFNYYFKIAYNSLPDGVWLKSLYISKDKFKFRGASLNPLQISKLYENLKNNFIKIDFKSTEKKGNNKNVYYTFTMNAINLKNREE